MARGLLDIPTLQGPRQSTHSVSKTQLSVSYKTRFPVSAPARTLEALLLCLLLLHAP